MRARLVRITGVDLNLFEFDYDLTWMAFFVTAEEKVYGRYGGRDATGPDARNSLAGLRYAMQAALEAHRRNPHARPRSLQGEPVYAERLNGARNVRGCIHCHQVKELMRDDLLAAGKWQRDNVWTYPLPENIGLSLEIDRGNVVRTVIKGSTTDRAGLRAGDLLQTLNGQGIHSFADAQYALHKAPARGKIAVSWLRDGKTMKAEVSLAEGWRKTDITWRPSLLELLPSLTLFGPDLSADEKKSLGLSEESLAFRQESPVHAEARAMGVQANDIIIGINQQKMEMTMRQFLAHVKGHYLVGDRLTLNLLRGGMRVDLPVKLR